MKRKKYNKKVIIMTFVLMTIFSLLYYTRSPFSLD